MGVESVGSGGVGGVRGVGGPSPSPEEQDYKDILDAINALREASASTDDWGKWMNCLNRAATALNKVSARGHLSSELQTPLNVIFKEITFYMSGPAGKTADMIKLSNELVKILDQLPFHPT